MREYKSGSKWAFWRWKDIVLDGELYLRRLHLLQTPFGSIFLHWIFKPDAHRCLHDHPTTFLSIVLKGWYYEWRTNDECHFVKWFNFIRGTDAHRIWSVAPGGALTLVFSTPSYRTWGFHTPRGWIPWRDYDEQQGDC